MRKRPVLFIGLGLLAAMAHAPAAPAWEGFDWNVWRGIAGAGPPTLETPQAGETELVPLLRADDGSRIDSIGAWEAKRDRILATLDELMGASETAERVPPYAEILGETRHGGFRRVQLRIAAEADDWIPAYLLLPEPPPDTPGPAAIVLHQTVKQGKDEPCGIEGSPEMAFASELAREGFICLAPDAIGFGERTPPGAPPYDGAHDFYRKHPGWSFFGKMAWDVRQLVDYLETLPFVDARRIACMGHSHGAYGTIAAAVFEPRISALIASCGFTTLRSDPVPERWSHLTALLPKLGFYKDAINEAPIDWHEIIACAAPRPFFLWSTRDDSIFPNTENFPEIFEQMKDVYALYGAAGDFAPFYEPGPHAFPDEHRRRAYDWLKDALPLSPDRESLNHRAPASAEAWERERDVIRNRILRDIGSVDPPALEPEFAIISERQAEGYTERLIEYLAERDEPIRAYLLLPEPLGDKHPAALVFHQTTEHGKEEPAGRKGRASLHFGPELARMGYIALMPDSIAAGGRIGPSGAFETKDYYAKRPGRSALAKMTADGRRALDVLTSIPQVDADRLAAIGHSLGAEEALFTAAFDARIKAAAASCGYSPMRVEPNLERWARPQWFAYVPKLRIDLRAGRRPAWDFDDAIRLIAPRGYFNYQTRDDDIFPEGDAAHPMTLACRTVWRLYGAEDMLRSRLDPGPHDIAPEAKRELYEWLNRVLNRGA